MSRMEENVCKKRLRKYVSKDALGWNPLYKKKHNQKEPILERYDTGLNSCEWKRKNAGLSGVIT